MTKEAYVPPPDPPFQDLARAAFLTWKVDAPFALAFDTETSGFHFHDRPFCVTVAWRKPDGRLEVHYIELGDEKRREAVRWMLRDTPQLIGHNIKFDLQKMIYEGLLDRDALTAERIDDTQALAHLDDEHRPKKLKELAVSLLGYDDTIEVEIKSGPNKGQMRKVAREKHELDSVRRKLKLKKDDGFHLLPRGVVYPYALKDAEWTHGLYEDLYGKVLLFDDLGRLYEQELEVTLVMLDMELAGMAADLPYVEQMERELIARVLEIEADIAMIVGKPVESAVLPTVVEDETFNPNSNPQIKEFFTAAGYERDSYSKDELKGIDHPLAPALVDLRKNLKLLNTYFRAIKKGAVDGVFHPSFRQHGTVTGRASSGAAKAD